MKPFDLQVNGYAGVDFCADNLTAEDLHHACKKLAADGVDSVLATLITDRVDRLVAKLKHFVQLREADSLVELVIKGFHIEGPFLNPTKGYIGAHDSDAVVEANVGDAQRLLSAAGGLTKLVTLAPEHDPGFKTIDFLVKEGVTVSAGHCDPTLDQLTEAVDHGLTMVTHFGNGCPLQLARHNNILQRVLHLRDRLWICFIPDGAHIEFFVLKNYLDLVGVDRAIMVTDAISAATLGPGRYEISGMSVEVDERGVARKPGSKNLAGSTVTMPVIADNLANQLGFSEQEISKLIDANPRAAVL
ncbi:MAG: N-acetylglucosamine-6-phosphate deacetylase [Pirellulaceae bacterium]|nr:N-acetylglucosamine-6-phosphate deacetylase [Pirellulaceae bacterium]